RKMTVIGLTGAGGGRLARLADIAIRAPAQQTYQIQELHLPIYHALCIAVENHFFPPAP
ncbi:MAG TPA: phosphoheptose isomerase, partial [Lentisphaeria bacterium]|nr:phosphoheptose isomerase [Lentisphaeria bacterium]